MLPKLYIEVNAIVAQVQSEFPNAAVNASTWDQFTSLLLASLAANEVSLPEIDLEMGDTWIYGISSDPKKVAMWRAILRQRSECVEEQLCDSDEYTEKKTRERVED